MAEKKGVAAYPLQWPKGWPRTKKPGSSKFKTANNKARSKLLNEISLMGGSLVVVSSNVPLNERGQMMERDPVDAGAAVYFQRQGKAMAFACDRYDLLRDNIHALALTIEALRGIERWGASEMMERAFSGFKQLAAENPGMSWWATLQLSAGATVDQIEKAYKAMARLAHPDIPGGSDVAMAALNAAREQGLNVARHRDD